MTELVPVARFRNTIPEDHRSSMDTRLAWLWKQRFGTVQSIWRDTDDVQDKTCCTLILQAVLAQDLNSSAEKSSITSVLLLQNLILMNLRKC